MAKCGDRRPSVVGRSATATGVFPPFSSNTSALPRASTAAPCGVRPVLGERRAEGLDSGRGSARRVQDDLGRDRALRVPTDGLIRRVALAEMHRDIADQLRAAMVLRQRLRAKPMRVGQRLATLGARTREREDRLFQIANEHQRLQPPGILQLIEASELQLRGVLCLIQQDLVKACGEAVARAGWSRKMHSARCIASSKLT